MWLWVNGAFVGHHLGHSTPRRFDLSPHVRAGAPHTVLLAVSNLTDAVSGMALRGYHGKSAGVYRSVHLHASGAGVIEHLHLRPGAEDLGTLAWRAELASPLGLRRASELRWRVLTLDGAKVLAAGSAPVPAVAAGETLCVEWRCGAGGLRAWSPDDPQRYLAAVTWADGGGVCDGRTQAFGLRLLRREGKRLRLNGRPIMLRGVCDHYYFPVECTAPTDVDYYRRQLRTLKELGFNFVRFHTWVPPAEYMQAADEVGFLLQPERPAGTGHDEWENMIRFCRAHPAVVSYCCGNEEYLDEAKIGEIERMYARAKELDPTCLVMPQEGMRGIEYTWVGDEIPQAAEQPFRHSPSRLGRISGCGDLFGQYSWALLSYFSLRGQWRQLQRRYAVYQRPLISHEIGLSGCYLDLDLERRYTGRIRPELFRDTRRRLRAGGREGMAGVYHRHSARWQWLTYRHVLETARRCDDIAGYDLLGGWDAHWHRSGYGCGLLNEFRQLKCGLSPEAVRQANADSVVLLDLGLARSFRAGEPFEMDVMVSLYGGRPVKKGKLRWQLSSGGRVLLRGDKPVGGVPDGRVSSLGPVAFAWPAVEQACKAELKLELVGGGYRLANRWDFWLFPKRPPPAVEASADQASGLWLSERYAGIGPNAREAGVRLRISSALGEEDLRHLRGGGDVLLLGGEPFPSRRTSFQMAVAGRPGGNLATVVNPHPVFEGFPHEGFCDWQFRSLLEGGQATIFNDLPIPFDPILEVVSSYKDMRWQGSLWEVRADGGRLFVAGCHFDLSEAASAALLDNILDYVSGERFDPVTRVSLGELSAAAATKAAAQTAPVTDMGFDPNAPRNRPVGPGQEGRKA